MLTTVICYDPHTGLDGSLNQPPKALGVDISHFKTLIAQAAHLQEGKKLVLPYSLSRFQNYLVWMNYLFMYMKSKSTDSDFVSGLKNKPRKRPLIELAIYLDDDRLTQIIEHYDNPQDTVELAAQLGNLTLVQYLCTHQLEFWPRGKLINLNSLFMRAAEYGQLEILDYLLDYFQFKEVESGVDFSSVLTVAAGQGRLEVLRWLCQRLDLKSPAQELELDPILNEAVYQEHLELVKFLLDYFNIQPLDDRINPASLLITAALKANLELAQLLTGRLQLTAVEARAEDNQALKEACRAGSRPMVEYLVKRFKLTIEDVRSSHNKALKEACWSGSVPLVDYLFDSCGLTIEDLKNSEGQSEAAQRGHMALVQYFFKRFGLPLH